MSPRRLVSTAILFSLAAFAHTPNAAATSPCDPNPDPEPLEVELVASYDPAALQTPESVATDYWGNRYVSLALTGEISRISHTGEVETLATLPITPMAPCGNFIEVMGALTVTPWGLYVNLNACDLDDRGVWWVSRYTGASARISALPADAQGNGIAHRFGKLYIADSLEGRIWRTPVWGGPAEVWVEDPLLDLLPNPFGAPGANGVQFFHHEMYVSNSSTGDIVVIPMEPGEMPGIPEVHANIETGCDDFAFDIHGTLYCTTNPFNTLVAIHPDGETEVLLTIDDGLDGPTSVAFGRLHDRHTLYIANAAFPIFPNQETPSLLSVELEVPGYPFR